MKLNKKFISSALPNARFIGNFDLDLPTFSVDSRTINPGEVFVALVGQQQDGHDFIADAFLKGAVGAVIEVQKESVLKKINATVLAQKLIIMVDNVHEALIKLATTWRNQFTFPVMAITGSVAKTSIKESIARVLQSTGKRFFVSHGNENSLTGVPINVLRLRPEHEGAIFEVGTNKRGEIKKLASVVRPTTALITNIGHCHMEGIGSLEDIAKEKRDIFAYFNADNIGIINGDTPLLSTVSYPHPVIRFGSKTTNQFQARKIRIAGGQAHFVLKAYKEKYQLSIPHPHASVVFNTLATTAACYLLGIPVEQIVKALREPVAIPERFEFCRASKGIIINDAYNANPESMKASLLAFQQIETPATKVAVLGDMFELGVNSPFWHRQLGRFLRKAPSLKHVILVGDMVKWAKKTLPINVHAHVVPSWQEAVPFVQKHLDDASMVLVKGSLSTGLRDLVKVFTRAA